MAKPTQFKSRSTILIVTLAALPFALLAAAILVFSEEESSVSEALVAMVAGVTDDKARKKLPMNYVSLDPPFVVGLNSNSEYRFLKISVEAGTRNPKVVELIKAHRPAIRNSLVLLFSDQSPEFLNTQEGKEQLRDQTLAEVKTVLKAEAGKTDVESIFFTDLAMQ